MGKRWTVAIALILLAWVLLVPGCIRKPAKKPAQPAIQIGISVARMDPDELTVMKKTLKEREKQDKTRITWQDAGDDAALQDQQIDALINKKVKAIIVRLGDQAKGEQLARKAKEKGIKLVAIQTLPPDTPLDGYISVDHYRMGELQGQLIRERIEQGTVAGRQVLLLQGDPLEAQTGEMTSGLRDALKGVPGVNIIVRSYPAGQESVAETELGQEMASLGDQLGAVVAQNAPLMQKALAVLQGRNRSGAVVTVGSGAGRQASQAIDEDKHDGESDPMPETVARDAYKAAIDLIKTGGWEYDTQVKSGNYDIPAKIVPSRLIEKDNLYLLDDRWDEGKGGQQAKGSSGGANSPKEKDKSSGQNDHSNSGGSKNGEEQGKESDQKGGQPASSKETTRLTIRTKDGKTMEINVNGEVESISVEKGPKPPVQQGGAGSRKAPES